MAESVLGSDLARSPRRAVGCSEPLGPWRTVATIRRRLGQPVSNRPVERGDRQKPMLAKSERDHGARGGRLPSNVRLGSC